MSNRMVLKVLNFKPSFWFFETNVFLKQLDYFDHKKMFEPRKEEQLEGGVW